MRHNTELVIYELHLRDFSVRDTSVPAADRGRYAAFTHGQSAGMQHLKLLASAGLTDVHLLPVFDLATVPEAGCTTPDETALGALAAGQRRAAGACDAPAPRKTASTGATTRCTSPHRKAAMPAMPPTAARGCWSSAAW